MAFLDQSRAPFAHRTKFGGVALVAWRDTVRTGGQLEPEHEWQVAECIADVLHMARALGVDTDKALERAAHHFAREAAMV